MTDKELKRAKELFPRLEIETTATLEMILSEIRKRDWSTIGNVMILKHDYIQMLLISKSRSEEV